MSGPHGTSFSSPSGADTPRSSADPSLRERSGLSLHAIRRARWGAPETGACAQPARSLPRSRRGRETQLLNHHPGANAGSRAEPLPCSASAPRRSYPATPTHTLDTLMRLHTSLSSWESDRLATDSSRAADPWGHVRPCTPSRPKAAGEGDQGPMVKAPRATSAKSPGQRSDTAAGRDSLASDEGPYCCRSPSPS